MVVSLLIALIYKNKLALWANNKPTYFYNKKSVHMSFNSRDGLSKKEKKKDYGNSSFQ